MLRTSQGSRKLYQILSADFHARRHPGTIPELMDELRKLKIATDGTSPEVKILDESNGANGKLQHIKFESALGIWLDATLHIPSAPGRKPAVLLVKGNNHFGVITLTALAEELTKRGQVVLEMEPRSSPIGNTGAPFTGDWITDVQANMIGENFPAMRAHDLLRGVDLLTARSDVDPGSIRGIANDEKGIWLLLAAAADPRINKIWLDKTPYSLSAALENSMTDRLWDAVIPNFVLHWDLKDLVVAMGKRPVIWTVPTNWVHGIVDLQPPYQYRYVLGDTTDLARVQDDAYISALLQ